MLGLEARPEINDIDTRSRGKLERQVERFGGH
jgi:hypothetical protein